MSSLNLRIKEPTTLTCRISNQVQTDTFSNYHGFLLLFDTNVQKYALAIARLLKTKPETRHINLFLEPVPAGEKSKTIMQVQFICQKYAGKIQKDSLIICVGGGMISDLGGFIAATFLRGIDYLVFPTSLLAQIDAAIGGKTAVNLFCPDTNLLTAKNMIGSFHLPKAVIIRHNWLHSLNQREIDSGWGELIKTAAIDSERFFQQVCVDFPDRMKCTHKWSKYIKKAIQVKIRLVQSDYQDRGIRRLLNFGHTIGHAIEVAHHYQIPHGVCVIAGMSLESSMAERLGLCQPTFAKQLDYIFQTYRAFYRFSHLSDIIPYLQQDKKNYGGNISFALLEAPGQAVKQEGNYTINLTLTKVTSVLNPLITRLNTV